ncbi:MAG: DUF368 domain-containing protein [Sphaerochaetaceae bacterium]|nr:DUF368 domain-containing protein [Sphaerochaetaceae bacterium]
MLINSIRGFIMSIADSLPGISGGTIAYILGFYDEFLLSLNNIISDNQIKRKNAFFFLIQLLSGWVIGMILSVIILSSLFSTHIYFMSSLLIGLTISAIPLILFEERNVFKTNFKSIIKYLFYFFIGFILVIFVSTSSTNTSSNPILLTNLNFNLSIKLILAGMLAISTMILPGISGSSVLVILKLYIPIINAIKMVITFNFDYLFALILFGIGILLGAVTTVKIVKYALNNHRSSTISFIIGLIIAAIYSIIIGPTTLEIPKEPLSLSTFNVTAFALGVFIIFVLQKLKHKKEGI